MNVGLSSGRADVDAQAGGVALQLRDAILAVAAFRSWLDRHDNAALLAMGYTAEDLPGIASMRAAYAALGKLADISNGQDTQSAASDFWWDARDLIGPRYR